MPNEIWEQLALNQVASGAVPDLGDRVNNYMSEEYEGQMLFFYGGVPELTMMPLDDLQWFLTNHEEMVAFYLEDNAIGIVRHFNIRRWLVSFLPQTDRKFSKRTILILY